MSITVSNELDEGAVVVPEMFAVVNEEGRLPVNNYTPYDLLSLQTRIVPRMELIFKRKGAFPLFSNILDDNKMSLTVAPTMGTKRIDMSEGQRAMLEDALKEVVADGFDYVMLMPFDDYYSDQYGRIPKSWVKQIAPFITISNEFGAYVNEYGLLVSLINDKFPQTRYAELSEYVVNELQSMYDEGVMLIQDLGLISEWGYEVLNEEHSIYRPVWTDRRITNNYSGPVGFMRSRLQGDTTITVDIGVSLSRRHLISKLFPCQFIGSHVRFEVLNLEDARRKLTQIPIAISKFYGAVVIITTISVKQALDYEDVIKQSSQAVTDTSIYKDEKGITVSAVFSYNTDPNEELRASIISYIEHKL